MNKEEKELWVAFASAALSGYTVTECIHHIKEDCAEAAEYADEMLRLFYEKFENC